MPQWQSLIADLAYILGKENVSTREADLAPYAGPGEASPLPQAIVWPRKTEAVAELLRFTRKLKIPVTLAGPSALPAPGGVVLDLKRMNRLRRANPVNLACEVEAGMTGEQLEKALGEKGLTLGCLPASLANSPVGAWLAGRAGGLHPSRLGQVADLVVSLEGVLPDGTVFRSRPTPRSAAGPDLDQVIVGSESTLAVITAAVLAVERQPELKVWRRFLFADLPSGLEALRALMQKGMDPIAAQLDDEPATRLQAASLHFELRKAGGCLLTLGFEGAAELTKLKAELGARLCRERCGEDLDEDLGVGALQQRDAASRNSSVALPESYAILDSIEFGAAWASLLPLYQAVRAATGSLALGLAHFSEPHREGASLCFTFAGQADDPNRLELVQQLCEKASEAGLSLRAAVCHPSLGPHPAQWTPAHHGAALDLYRGLKHFLDPDNFLNPGKTRV